MIGCVPETIFARHGNSDENIDAVKSAEESKEIVKITKKNNRKSNRTKKTNEIE